ILASWSGAEEEQAAALPRGWFGIASMNRPLTERRLLPDLTMLTRAGPVQAACHDCRAYLTAVPRPGQCKAKSYLAPVALLPRCLPTPPFRGETRRVGKR